MVELQIPEDYICYGSQQGSQDNLSAWVGLATKSMNPCRGALRFPLTTFPLGVTITKVELQFWVVVPDGAAHLLDIFAYAGDGQSDPEDDFVLGFPQCGQNIFAKALSANQYYNDGIECRTTGIKKVTLLGTVAADIQAAKLAVDRFSVGLVEDGDNDEYANISKEYCLLIITYEAVRFFYGDGLVYVQT